MTRSPVAILGVAFDNLTMAEALTRIESMIASRRPHYVVTANVDFIVQARTDVELRRIFLEAHLVLCDGTPVLWASRLLGNPLPERVAGADLVPLLIKAAAKKKYRLFFLGATPASAQAATARLQAQFPEVVIAGSYSPPFRKLLEMDHQEIKRRIVESRPDVLLVAFGCPKQEKWMAMHYRELGVPVAVGVGATIDFLAGQVRRAPRWMQRTGLEWVFRLAQEPGRLFQRYAKDLRTFGTDLCRQWWLLGRTRHRRPDRSGELQNPERLSPGRAEPTAQFVLDLSTWQAIDSAGIARLMRLQQEITAAGGDLCLVNPTPLVRRVLRFMRLEDFFMVAPDLTAGRALLEERATAGEAQVLARANGEAPNLAWRGEITAATGDRVWEQTKALLTGTAPERGWHIDLSEVRFIDSTGLGVMVRSKRLAHERKRELRFTNLQPAVRNVVQLAALEAALLDQAAHGNRPRAYRGRLQ
ncbi:MAG TPA: WecB/TagA/CpsF family glycosyltransferase [Verrucomicrobiae bacterium]|nr:WecB/TagA/CpsF family glycosyltransferase [Verrucomicrobiae bacterium]